MTKTVLLYIATAVAEILGCYLPYCYVKRDGSLQLLIPTALSLIAFVRLLMLHPAASGRVYAAYGGVYILTALLWLRFIDGIKLSPQDWLGAAVVLCGVVIMIGGWRHGVDLAGLPVVARRGGLTTRPRHRLGSH